MYILIDKTKRTILKVLFIAVTLLLTGCRCRSEHLDLPNNRLTFPAEGGQLQYTYERHIQFDWESDVIIDGKIAECKPYYKEGQIVGREYDGWLVIMVGGYTGYTSSTKLFEATPNDTGLPRMVEIKCYIEGPTYYDCELYLSQPAL